MTNLIWPVELKVGEFVCWKAGCRGNVEFRVFVVGFDDKPFWSCRHDADECARTALRFAQGTLQQGAAARVRAVDLMLAGEKAMADAKWEAEKAAMIRDGKRFCRLCERRTVDPGFSTCEVCNPAPKS